MKTITAMITIALLEGFAIYQGINGVMLGFAIAAIAGLGGYHFKKLPFLK